MRGLELRRNGLPNDDGMPHRAAALEELLLLWSANRNEAFKRFEELFEDKALSRDALLSTSDKGTPRVWRHVPPCPSKERAISLLDLLRGSGVGRARDRRASNWPSFAEFWKPLLAIAWNAFCSLPARFFMKKSWLYGCNSTRPPCRLVPPRKRLLAGAARVGTQQWP